MRRLLGQAIYHLHWAPAVFWSATLHELEAAMEVAEAQNPKHQQSDQPTPEFIALRDAHLAKENRTEP